jgi:putative membrane protein
MNSKGTESTTQDTQMQLAAARTEMAYRRTLLADERTYSAWIRTGLASLATGFAIAHLLTSAGPIWIIRVLGILFIAAGGVMFAMAFLAYRRAIRQMKEPISGGFPIWIVGTLTLALFVGAALGLTLVFH